MKRLKVGRCSLQYEKVGGLNELGHVELTEDAENTRPARTTDPANAGGSGVAQCAGHAGQLKKL